MSAFRRSVRITRPSETDAELPTCSLTGVRKNVGRSNFFWLRTKAPSDVSQRLSNLPDDGIIGALVAVEIVNGGSQKVRTPLGADPAGVFENRRQELVFVAVV